MGVELGVPIVVEAWSLDDYRDATPDLAGFGGALIAADVQDVPLALARLSSFVAQVAQYTEGQYTKTYQVKGLGLAVYKLGTNKYLLRVTVFGNVRCTKPFHIPELEQVFGILRDQLQLQSSLLDIRLYRENSDVKGGILKALADFQAASGYTYMDRIVGMR